MDENKSTAISPLPQFCPEMAKLIGLALTSYGTMLRSAVEYTNTANPELLATLHGQAKTVGLELLIFVRTTEMIGENFPAGDHPKPVMPLARALGESFAILGVVENVETMNRLPVASLEYIDSFYNEDSRAWLSRYLPELPQKQGLDGKLETSYKVDDYR